MDKKTDNQIRRIEQLRLVSEHLIENAVQLQGLLERQKAAIESLQHILESMEKTRQLLLKSKQPDRSDGQYKTAARRQFEKIGTALQTVLHIQEQLLAETLRQSGRQSKKSVRLMKELTMLKREFSP